MTQNPFATLSDDIDDYCFIDTETKARRGTPPELASVVTAGTYAYAENAVVVVITYAIGDGPVQCVAMDDGWQEGGFQLHDLPLDLRQFWGPAQRLEGKWFVAFNAGFDRVALRSVQGTLRLPPEAMIDCMAQVLASNLAPSLEGAARSLKLAGKQDDGKALINLFTKPDAPQPRERWEEWQRFKSYAVRDTALLREVFKATRKLPRREWEEYWASERINERGFMIDTEFCARAADIADANVDRSNARLAQITRERIDRVTQVQRIAQWVYDRLEHAEAREIMVKLYSEEDGEVKPAKLGLDRPRIEALLAFFDALEERQGGLSEIDIAICEVLEIRQWDGSSSPGKFDKMLLQASSDDVLRGSYVFNGAQQTGRYCVAAETPIETPHGVKPIVSLQPGDMVISGLNRSCRVLRKIYKGREAMFRVEGPAGEVIEATGNHRVLTLSGWRSLHECFEKGAEGQGSLRRDCEPISVVRRDYGGYSGTQRRDVPHGIGSAEAGAVTGRETIFARRLPFAVEDRRAEPYARRAESCREDHAQGAGLAVERFWLHVRTPHDSGEVARVGRASAPLGGAPHRRGQDKQRSEQPGDSNEVRAPETTPEKGWTFVRLGERDVWDISVEGDESYIAGGMIHHNSSKGVQVHNLPNKYIGLESKEPEREAAAIEMINELEI